MNKFEKWFYGIMTSDEAVGYQYIRQPLTSPWYMLRNFSTDLFVSFNMLTVVFITLKILGYFDGGWVLAFMPSIIRAILDAAISALDTRQRMLKERAAEERRRKLDELWQEERKKDLMAYEDGVQEEEGEKNGIS